MSSYYTLDEHTKLQFAGLYVLSYLKDSGERLPIALSGHQMALQPILHFLLEQDYLEVDATEHYVQTSKGQDVLDSFLTRFTKFLEYYDVFCAVDLAEGEFAFERYHDFGEDEGEAWAEYVDQDRFADLRVAVAKQDGLDPIEVVFLSMVAEGRFGVDDHGQWSEERLTGEVWEKILLLVNQALSVDDLGYEDEQGRVSGLEVLEDVMAQGRELRARL